MPKRKSTNQLTKQVGIARAKRARKGDSSNKPDSSQKDVQSNVADTVSLDKLADVMIDKMTQRGLIFASSPAVSQSSVSGTVVQEDSLSAATINAPGSGQDILCGNTATVMHHASSHESSQDNNIQTVLSQPVAAAHSSSDKEVEQLLNGMPINTNSLPLNQSFFYGLSLSALVPDKIKSQIWDKTFLEMSQLYQIQTRGEIKQDVSVNISNQGSSTLVKVQPKQTQGHDLSISQWLTAFNCYMDVYVQKFPNETSSLLAYMNLIRDLERSCGTQAFNYYDRSFRAHRQSQNLPWGQMHSEIWNKSVLLSLSNQSSQTVGRYNASTNFRGGNRKFCFQFNSGQGCLRRQCRFTHLCNFCYKKHSRNDCYALKNQNRVPVSQSPHTPDSQIVSGHSLLASNKQGTRQSADAIQTRTQSFRGNK